MIFKRWYWLFLLLVPLFVIGCASVGKEVIVSDLNSISQLPKGDKKLWDMSGYEERTLNKSGLVYSDSLLSSYLQTIGNRMIPPEYKNSIFKFRFYVIQDPELNAFALPNGAIYLHVGLLSKLENTDQLAFIIGHEMTHVLRRHAAYQYANIKNVSGFAQFLSVAAAVGFSQSGSNMGGFWNSLAQNGLALTAMAAVSGYSRSDEKESDLTALEFMEKAGYDKTQAARALEILLEEYPDKSATANFFYGNHPLTKQRLGYIKETIGYKGEKFEGAIDHSYQQEVKQLKLKNVELFVFNSKYDKALKQSGQIESLYSQDPALHYWRGEAYRMASSKADTLKLAEDEYQKALDLDSTFAPAHLGLAELWQSRGNKQEALIHYQTYLKMDPQAKKSRYIESRIKALKEEPTPQTPKNQK